MNAIAIIALVITVVFAVDFNLMTAVSSKDSRYIPAIEKMFKRIGLGKLAPRLYIVGYFPKVRQWSIAAFSVSAIVTLTCAELAQNVSISVATLAVAIVAYAVAFYTLYTQDAK